MTIERSFRPGPCQHGATRPPHSPCVGEGLARQVAKPCWCQNFWRACWVDHGLGGVSWARKRGPHFGPIMWATLWPKAPRSSQKGPWQFVLNPGPCFWAWGSGPEIGLAGEGRASSAQSTPSNPTEPGHACNSSIRAEIHLATSGRRSQECSQRGLRAGRFPELMELDVLCRS